MTSALRSARCRARPPATTPARPPRRPRPCARTCALRAASAGGSARRARRTPPRHRRAAARPAPRQASPPVLLQETQPELAARREAGHGVPEALERDLADDGDGRRVDELADVDAGERRADDHAAVLVDDDPRRARGVVPVERAARVRAAADLDDA